MCVSSLHQYSLRVNDTKWLRAAVVVAVVASSVALPVLVSPTALAAPGDAGAVGFDADFHGTMAGGDPIELVTQRGSTSAPPASSQTLTGDDTAIDITLGAPLNQDVRVAVASGISSSSTSSAGSALAKASATDITISTPLGPLVITGEVSSSVSCQYNQQPTAGPNAVPTATLNGAPVTFDDNGVATIKLDNPIGTATITLTVAQPVIDATTATSTGLLYSLDENLTDLLSASGTLAIARSTCQTPQPPTVTTSGVLRAAATGAPLRGCVLVDSTSAPGNSQLVWTNGDGSWQYTGNLPGPLALAFFTAANQDCNQTILNSPVPSWYQNQPLSGSTARDLKPPDGITEVDAGSTGIVACLGATALPTGPCAQPTVVLSGRAITPDPGGGTPAGVPQACVIVLRNAPADSDPVVGFGLADDQGAWQVTGLPQDTPMVVAVIPPFIGPDGPCSSDGPPPAPPKGSLQPEFYRDTWIDLTDRNLFADPYGWAVAHGADLVTGSAAGLDVCLTTDFGSDVTRAGCDPAPPTSSSVPTTSSAPTTVTETVATSVDSTRTVAVNVVAVGVATTTTYAGGDAQLAATGGPWTSWMWLGLAMVVLGFGLVGLSRRGPDPADPPRHAAR